MNSKHGLGSHDTITLTDIDCCDVDWGMQSCAEDLMTRRTLPKLP